MFAYIFELSFLNYTYDESIEFVFQKFRIYVEIHLKQEYFLFR